MLEFVSSIINHRVNLGKLLKIFQVAKNHNEAFTSSNVYSVIHQQQRLERWHSPRVGSFWKASVLCRSPGPGTRCWRGFDGSCTGGFPALGTGAGVSIYEHLQESWREASDKGL